MLSSLHLPLPASPRVLCMVVGCGPELARWHCFIFCVALLEHSFSVSLSLPVRRAPSRLASWHRSATLVGTLCPFAPPAASCAPQLYPLPPHPLRAPIPSPSSRVLCSLSLPLSHSPAQTCPDRPRHPGVHVRSASPFPVSPFVVRPVWRHAGQPSLSSFPRIRH